MKLKYKIIKKSDIMSHSSFKILKSLYNLYQLAPKSDFFDLSKLSISALIASWIILFY